MDGGAWGGRSANDDLGERPAAQQAAAPEADTRLLFRFGLGLAGLATERMGALFATSFGAAGGPATVEALSGRWPAIAASTRRLSARLVRACGLLAWLPGVPRRAAELRAWQAKEGSRLARWAAARRRERARSRALARAALSTLRQTALEHLVESPDRLDRRAVQDSRRL
ncbi:MAG TPA: hypothetical protein VI456_10895 [Polyangia bacterium]